MSARTRRSLTLLWTALFVLSLGLQYMTFAAPASTLAVHDEGFFELDGNAVTNHGAGLPDDWDRVYAGTSGAASEFFEHDLVDDQSDDTYTGGSTKDDIDFPSWLWKEAKASQAKNDITDAFAASYTAANGDLFAYFGLSKWEADGNNYAGFWFLRDSVGPTGTGNPPGSPFSGVHQVGDVLVLANYTNGGSLADFDVFEWVGTGGDANAAGTLDTVASGVPCTGGADDLACGASNGTNITSPWPYQGRDSNGNPLAPDTMGPGTFFEGGINLTQLGLDEGCYTSFFAETRASQSVDATLSDFVAGQFSFCAPPTIATQVSASTINVGESVTDTATLTGDKGVVEGTVAFYVCGPEASAPDCSTGGTKVGATKTLSGGTATSDPFPVDDPDATGFYCFRAEYTPAAGSKYLAASHTNLTTECFEVIPAGIDVEKTALDDTVNANDPIGFDITVTSTDVGTAFGVSLTDTLPAGFDWSIAPGYPQGDLTGLSCAIAAGVLTCTDNAMPPGDSFTVRVIADTTAEDCGAVPNTASVATTNDGDDTDDATITIQCPALTITKEPDAGDPGSVINAGDDAVFSITVANSAAAGTGTAYDVVLDDTLPAGLTWTESPDLAQCTITGGNVLHCDVGDLAPGASFTVTVKATTTFATCTTYPNVANADAANHGQVSDPGQIECRTATIEILKTADDELVDAGDPIGFTVTVNNNGTGTAYGVEVDDPLPAGVTWTIDGGANAAECEIVGGVLSCDFGDMAGGTTKTVHIGAQTSFQACAVYDNTATVTTTNDGTDEASAVIECQAPDLSIVKTADDDVVNAGDPIGFGITVSNAGPGLAKAVTLSDPLPAGVTWTIDGGADAADCQIVANVLSCAFGDLAAGASASVHVGAVTSGDACSVYDNTATASATNHPDVDDDAVITCEPPDITVDKNAVTTPINAGETAEFSIEVWNAGPGVAYDVTLTDTLPAGVTWVVDATIPAGLDCEIVGQTLTCDLGDLAPEGEGDENHVFIYLTGQTSFAQCTEGDFELLNSVVVAATNEPANAPLPNSDEATIVVECPEIGISKEADHEGSVSAGDEVGFTVTIGNTGDGTAFDVSVSDALPAGLLWALDSTDARWEISGPAGAQVLSFEGDLASGEFSSAHVTADSSPEDCGVIPNEAFLFMDEQPAGSDDAAEVVDCPNVTVTKEADNATVSAGDPIGFVVVITNEGPGTAYAAWGSDPLPGDGWSIESGDEGWTLEGSQLAFAGDLAAGQSATVHVVRDTTADDCGTVPNTVTVGAENEAEADTDDNEASASVDVLCAEIDIEKTADAESVVAGEQIGFWVTVTNNGEGDAYGVAVSDPLPTTAGLAWSLESADDRWSIVDGELVFEAEVLQPGASSSAHVVSDTTEASCAVIDNTATVTTTNDGSDEDSASTEVICIPELTIEKSNDAPVETIDLGDGVTVDLPTLEEGQSAIFTLQYTLVNGPVDNGVVTDVLPEGMAYVDGTASSNDEFTFVGFDEATRTLRWEADTVTESGTLTYEAQAQEGASDLAQPLVNVATIDSDQTEPDSDDSDVYVPIVEAVTSSPSVTPPPTDTFAPATQAPSNPGFALMLVLLGLAGFALTLGLITPVPERVRRRDRRS